jgi:hypothetical protein
MILRQRKLRHPQAVERKSSVIDNCAWQCLGRGRKRR